MTTALKINDEYSEKCLLAMMVTDSSIVEMVVGQISRDYFFNTTNQKIYNKICHLQRQQKPINLITVSDGESFDVQKQCAEFTSLVSGSSEWVFYANALTECYVRRMARNDVKSFLENNSEDITANIDELTTKLSKYSVKRTNAFTMNALAIENVKLVENAAKSNVLFTGFESGFENLDTIIDGWQQGTMYVIGARPSIGKTAFALSILVGLARKGQKAAMFSLEMSATSLYFRMVSAMAGIPMWQIRKGLISKSQGQIGKYVNAGNILSNLPISIYDTEVDIDKTLYSKIRYEARFKGTKVFVIDHIGLIEVSDSSGQRYIDVGRITKTLHKMAKELNICIITLAQCGREAEGKKPNLALLRESGNIEQDGDVIMLLHRKREITDTEEKDPLAELPTDVIVAKNRDGRTGTATFAFQPTTMRFREDVGRSALDELGESNERVKSKERQEKDNEIPF